ncbi:uncharacterized protein LOC135243777 [Anguilla rostrata]|uniref:uncharacterized protein LOC135243777 n=1 Tax=Anguilla rostrata TaxID=7938 RepID=UPI0030CB8511
MSTGEDHLVFESFLKKRMKLKWVSYWFRLQNSVLCFYTQKAGSSLQLKGQYYIWMVQSVREVQKAEGKRYAFEISMNNGKKKLLAADTADLRQTWVGLLWRAMQSPGHRHPNPACIWQEGAELRPSWRGSPRSVPSGGERRELDRGRLRAASEPWNGTTLTLDPRCPATPPTAASNPVSLVSAAAFDSGLWRSSQGPPDEEEEDAEADDYDVLPCRTTAHLLQEEEGIYDVPLSNMRVTEDPPPGYRVIEESIYDVPSSLLRRLSERSIGTQSERAWLPDGGGVPQGDQASFQSGTVGWMTPAAEG